MFGSIFVLIGRALIGAMFIWDGVDKIMNWDKTITHFTEKKIYKHDLYLPVLFVLEIVGGLSLVFGFLVSVGAILLLLVKIPTLLKFHSFWDFQGEERKAKMHKFMKELIIIGSLIVLFGIGLI